MASLLMQYIEESAKTPWGWGTMDCVMLASGWVLRVTGVDIASVIRGKYSSPKQALRLIKKNGGFVQGIGDHLDTMFQRTQSPQDGDIGIVDAPIAMRDRMPVCGAVMAVRNGGMWVCKSAHGMVGGDIPYVAAWRIEWTRS